MQYFYPHLKLNKIRLANISQMNKIIMRLRITMMSVMVSEETMRCRKVRRILRYQVPNKLLCPEKFAHHVLLLFYSFR